MNKRILLAGLFLATGLALLTMARLLSTEQPPNVLLIVLDDFGYSDLGANGGTEVTTPNLDAFAAQGIRYTRHYADASCSVARAALLTGRFASDFGFRPTRIGLPPGTATIASALRDVGYHTEHIGKWHVGNATLDHSPTSLGFNRWFGFLFQHELAGTSEDGINYRDPTYIDPWLRDGDTHAIQHQGHLTDIITERAVSFVRSQSRTEQPWFLNLWYYAPHGPVQPAERYAARHERSPKGKHLALIEQVDDGIGQVLRALAENGHADNTLVIILGDNGGTGTRYENNTPFKGRKAHLLEGGIRTPLLLRMPGGGPGGKTDDRLVSIHDIFPTIAGFARAPSPPQLAGKNLFATEPVPQSDLYWEMISHDNYSFSVLSVDGRWRLTDHFIYRPRLYDLLNDPSATANVAEQNPAVADRLRQSYLTWRMQNRQVDYLYQARGKSGAATLTGADTLRAPGYAGFTFAVAVTPGNAEPEGAQVIASQNKGWQLRMARDGTLSADILGISLQGPALPPGRCSEVVVSSYHHFSPIRPAGYRADVYLYVNGALAAYERRNGPPLRIAHFSEPTLVGLASEGGDDFTGTLGRPLLLSEVILPDAEAAPINNGIGDVPPVCATL